nr:auxilin-related protein 2-like [Ipomoea batatas]
MRSDGGDHRFASARSSPFFDDREGPMFNDVFGGPPKNKKIQQEQAVVHESFRNAREWTTGHRPNSTFDAVEFASNSPRARFSPSNASKKNPGADGVLRRRPLSLLLDHIAEILLFYCGCRWSLVPTVDCTARLGPPLQTQLETVDHRHYGISAGVPLTFVADAPTSLELLANLVEQPP